MDKLFPKKNLGLHLFVFLCSLLMLTVFVGAIIGIDDYVFIILLLLIVVYLFIKIKLRDWLLTHIKTPDIYVGILTSSVFSMSFFSWWYFIKGVYFGLEGILALIGIFFLINVLVLVYKLLRLK